MKFNPPRRALQFLRWFCREDYLEEIEGDLTEIFEKQFESSPAKAKRKFTWSVINYFRPEFIKSFKTNYHTNTTAMFRHNLLITYRNFLRYKSSFFINLIGLSSGLAAVLLIYMWVYDELSFDKFHENDKRLFQIMRNLTEEPDQIRTFDANSVLLAPALAAEMPEIEYAVSVSRSFGDGILTFDKKGVKASGKFADKDFFKMFSYPLIEGEKSSVFTDKYEIVISDALAIKLFGRTNGITGKTIMWDQNPYEGSYVVSGVFKTSGYNSSDQSDFVLTNDAYLDHANQYWDSNNVQTYLTLKEGADSDQFNRKIKNFVKDKFKTLYGSENLHFIATAFIRPYADKYLYNRYENGVQAGGRIDYVILFSTVAVFILLIACVNFMNLCTARASRRLKEIGVKKAIGAFRNTLAVQYMAESLCVVSLSFIISIIFVILLLPKFNLITGKHLSLTPNFDLILGSLVIVLITGLISGSYPALYLSGFKTVEMLKGKLSASFGELWIRRGLVVFQFVISILLIVSVVIVYNQMDFIHSKNLGYAKENIITLRMDRKINEKLTSYLSEVKSISGVENAAIMGNKLGFPGGTGMVDWDGKKERVEFSILEVGYDLIELLEIQTIEGRSFSSEFSTDSSTLILNETAAKSMGLKDVVGKTIKLWHKDFQVIGITKDFYFESLYESVKPCIIRLIPTGGNILIKIQGGTEKETIARLTKHYQSYNPGIPFDFQFLDKEYQALYTSEQKVADLSLYFASIAILISCLGLFGLAAFTAERRIKEIGIRKILGCSELGIVRMLSGDFTKMVLLSIIIALPISYFIANSWLESFAYRIDLQWWFFVGAGLAALIIAWITVGLQTVRAARANPVESLKME